MKNIRNLTALMSSMILAVSVMALPTGTDANSFEDYLNTNGQRQSFADMLKEKTDTGCTMEALEDLPIDASRILDNEYRTPVKVSEIAKNSVDDTAEEQNTVDDTAEEQNAVDDTAEEQNTVDEITANDKIVVAVPQLKKPVKLDYTAPGKVTDKQTLADQLIEEMNNNKTSSLSSLSSDDSNKIKTVQFKTPPAPVKVN